MKRVIDFMKSRRAMSIVSALVIIGGIVGTVVQGGFNLGIDFEAGLNLTVEIDEPGKNIAVSQVRDVLSDYDGAQIRHLGDDADDRFIIRVRDDGTVEDFEQVVSADVLDSLRAGFPDASIEELRASYVGPRFSEALTQQAVFLTIFALVLILVYLWFRFRLGYAVASIAALIHDVLVILGVIGTFQLEVSTATIAAVLTIIGYSLNDTIVIFDRARENESLHRDSSFRTVINTSITQSLSRTLITSLTTLLAVAAIFVFSTGQIELFALKLLIGVVVGTYSSIFVASPALLVLHTSSIARRKKRDLEKYHKGAVDKGSASSSEGDGQPAQPATSKPTSADVENAKRAIARQRSKKKGKKSK